MTQRPNWFIGFPVTDRWVPGAVAGLPPEIRTFRGEDMHITIAFLGPCGETSANAAWQALRNVAPAHLGAPFELPLGAVLPFGNPERPSSLSVVPTVADNPATTFLERHRNTLRAAAGLSLDHRPVRPHATIARLPRRGPQPLRERALAWAAERAPVNVTVQIDEIALYTWTDFRERQLFYIVDRAPLG